ncbi:MAG: DUF1887 family protein [Firmicutes bacterium]|nr:DUF1887 family protein [Bacillota bacterium]
MIVNIEFLDIEPIENVITCLNYKVDKVIFFGYEDVIAQRGTSTEFFLKRHCGVSEVEFYTMSETNLDGVVEEMSAVIEREQSASNQVFFDVTGGEGLLLLAFGALSKEKRLPMHKFDVEKGWLYELNSDVKPTLSECATKEHKAMDIDMYIQMHGGVVNHSMHKDTKNLDDPDFENDTIGLWEICNKYKHTWNIFCEFLREFCHPSANLQVSMDLADIRSRIQAKSKYQKQDMTNIFVECGKLGVLENLISDGITCTFRYKSSRIQDQLWDAGSILELHTYMEYKQGSTDCLVGVHIDWDGTIHGGWGRDTVNEIDVLALKDYVPTFISCKNGNVDQMALYEIETVASRFGGKYAKKVLVAPQGLNKSHRIRAREMNIEVR